MMAHVQPFASFEGQLPAELESVVAARRLIVTNAAAWGISESVIDDAALAISELVTNAVLHARTAITVRARRLGRGLRIEVGDGSSHLPIVGASRPEDLLENRTMTGRGLALVAAVSDRWGADPSSEGKVTWAEIGTGTRLVATVPSPAFPPPPRAPALSPTARRAGVSAASAVAKDGRSVHLIGVPVALLVESTSQLLDLQREMQVVAMDQHAAPELEPVVSAVAPLEPSLDHWAEVDRMRAEAAVACGEETLDWELTVPSDILDLMDQVAAWFRRSASDLVRRHLLSTPASEEVVAYRRWYREEILSQMAGRPPRPCPLRVPAS